LTKQLIAFSLLTVIACDYATAQLPQQWVQTFQAQGKAADRIAAITTDNAGNVYTVGQAGSHHGAPDAFAMKRSPLGDTLWTWYYDGMGNNEDYATDIEVDNAGNAYVTGRSQGTSYFFECFTAKIGPTGNPAWETRYAPGNNTQTFGNALALDAAGNVYVAGYTDPASGNNDWLVIKYNSLGVQQWVDVLNGPGNWDDEALDIVIAPNGNPTVCGYAYSVNASGHFNSFVKQYTPSNGTAWTDTWTNPSFNAADKAYGLRYNAAGDLLVGGETVNSTGGNRDAYAIRYSGSGSRKWVKIYSDASTASDEYLTDVIVDDSGNVFFAGTNYQDAYLTCIRSNGTQGWRSLWTGPLSNGSDVFHGITADDQGNVYATGRGVYPGPSYYGNGGLPNMIIVKYDANGATLWTYRCQEQENSSMGFAITYANGRISAGGFVTDTADVDENLYTLNLDTSGAILSEWKYNGRGDAITSGQFVQTDSAHNIYVGATVDRLYSGGTDVVVVKYDSYGDLLWERYYSSGGFRNDTLTAMQLDPSGDIILCLSTDANQTMTNYQISLLRLDQQGNFTDTVWYTGPGSVIASAMDIDPNGSIGIAANSSTAGGMLIVFDSSLSLRWAAKIDSTQFAISRANSVEFFENGDLAAGGYSQVSGQSAGLIQRYSALGTKLWSATIDSLNVTDIINDVSVRGYADIAFTGSSGNRAIVGSMNAFSGNPVWREVYNPTTTSEYGKKVQFTPAGNIAFICRGWTGFVARYFTVQYSGTGAFQWASIYSQTASDREPVDMLVDANNLVVTAGWALSGTTTNHDYVLAAYGSTGASAFVNTYSTPAAPYFSWDELTDMTSDSLGNFILTGRTASEYYNDFLFKTLTVKYGNFVVGTEESGGTHSQSILVFPNPSTDGIFTVLDASPEPIVYGRVYDIQGRQIAVMDKESGKVDLSASRPGVYVLVLERETSSTVRTRLIRK